ncbi:MAG TPA: hypothetical protein ENK06_11280 [Gammaproteobacteria bacterium]|nr:hypothetical protein [Gammaproteobacteria bacterium]
MPLKSSYQTTIIALLLVVLLPFLLACSPETASRKEVHDALKAVIAKRKLAIESKDIEAYKKLFLPEYRDGGVTYKILIQDMADIFSRFEKISFTYQINPMNFKMNTARMVAMVSYKTDTMEKPVFHHEKTVFRRVNGQWYISGGVAIGLF